MQSNPEIDRTLNQIQLLLGSGPTLEAKEVDINDLSRILVKMPNK
jgi:hypothetical protein